MIKTIRYGGHQIPNVVNVSAIIYSPGHLIPNLAKENFKLLAYFLRHSTRVSRTVAMAEITRNNVSSIAEIRDEEKNHTEPTTKPEILTGNWLKIQDAIIEWLSRYQGNNHSPLAYVCIDNINPSPEANDPSINYDAVKDKIISSTPIESAPGVF